MRLYKRRLGLALATLLALTQFTPQASGYDPYVYENLQRSRDALLSQKAELQRAYNDVASQIDKLQLKLTRLDSYLRQVDSSLKDVDSALSTVR